MSGDGSRHHGPRFPFGPLADYYGPVIVPNLTGPRSLVSPTRVIGELAGVNRRTISRWQRDGIPERHADRLAVAVGAHPSEIWPDWLDA